MRTTVRLDDKLLAAAKAHAARNGQTLTALMEQALRDALRQPRARNDRRKPVLATYGDGGLRPGVDLEDSAALLDLMGD